MTALARGVSQKHRHHRHDRHAGGEGDSYGSRQGVSQNCCHHRHRCHPKGQLPAEERKIWIMPYAILRFQKRKAGGVAACERHNERKKEAYKSNPDIDMERSKNNYHLIAPPKYTYKKEINRMVAEAGCRTRKDSVMMVETLITASPEFMNQLPPEEQKAYFTDGSGLHFGACRRAEYPLRCRPYGRENAPYAPLLCADYARQ